MHCRCIKFYIATNIMLEVVMTKPNTFNDVPFKNSLHITQKKKTLYLNKKLFKFM